jgi:hypothetical protein
MAQSVENRIPMIILVCNITIIEATNYFELSSESEGNQVYDFNNYIIPIGNKNLAQGMFTDGELYITLMAP